MRSTSRFIPVEEIDAVAQWQFGDVDPSSVAAKITPTAQDESAPDAELAQQLGQAREQGYAEGFVQGRAQALHEARQQMDEFMQHQGRELAQRTDDLLKAMQGDLDALRETSAQEVLTLACELARQVLRHEIKANPLALLPVVREGLELLVDDSRPVRIRLHPEDLMPMQEAVDKEYAELAPVLLADEAMERGGCRIESPVSVVDAAVARRWQRAVAQLGLNVAWEGDGDAA